MDVAEPLTGRPDEAPSGAVPGCPRCGEFAGPLAPVPSFTLGRVSVARCARCGTRHTHEATPRLVFTCASCGVPFLANAILPHDDHRCSDCSAGRVPPDLPSGEIAAATESEIRLALDGRWRFVTAPAAQAYLDRIARQVAARIEGGAPEARVVLFDDAFHRSLALPSGTLLLSTGLLGFLEDEAELAFVLGHELAHAASGDAAVRLSRLGFEASARRRDGNSDEAWAEAASDLVRLGYGRRRERDADGRAIEAVLALSYDADSTTRYLSRCGTGVAKADYALAEFALAHPPAADRARRIDRALYGRVRADATPKVNREVFRRAVSREALASGVVPVHLGPLPAGSDGAHASRSPVWRAVLWIGAFALAAGLVAAAVHFLR